jgi:geranylgeranyl diphosphate synthase type I
VLVDGVDGVDGVDAAIGAVPGPAVEPAGPARPPQAPEHLERIARRVEVRLGALFDAEQQRWEAVDPDLAPPLQALRQLVVQGGKRLRPAFCHWGFVAVGGSPDDARAQADVDDAGVAFELLHAFALVHDDVMDGSDRRRGEPTAQVTFGARHTAGGWRGETRRFGESIAILIGDLAHVYADRMMADKPSATFGIWRELQTELMMGQFLDVLGTARSDRSATKANLIVQLKSGRYTVERPLQIGVALAVGDGTRHRRHGTRRRSDGTGVEDRARRAAAALDAYGRPLGTAFQLRDDVLGAFGDSSTMGKPVGADLREGKPTPLLAHATDHANAAERRILDRVGLPDLGDADIAMVQEILIATGALAAIETSISSLTEEAIAAVHHPSVEPIASAALVDLARFIAVREH